MKSTNRVNSILLVFSVILVLLENVSTLDLGSKKFFRGKLFMDLKEAKHISASHKDVPPLWFEQQKVNHFDPNDNRVWSQKYFMNRSFYKHGSPVFISLGGEGALSDYDVTSSGVAEMGMQLNAFLISVEHRFYGESHPTNDTSVESMELLTSQQALADFITIIPYLKHKYSLNDNKWVVFGCSYAGNLAAWIRIRYPHLIYAAVASSAPVLAEFDFKEYFGKIGETILETSPSCYWTLNDAFTSLPHYVNVENCCGNATGKNYAHLTSLKDTFGLCEDLNPKDKSEVESFYSTLVNYWASVAQYNNVANGYALGGLNLDYLCQVLLTPLDSPLPVVPQLNSRTYSEEPPPKRNSIVNPSVEKLGRLILHLNNFYGRSCTQASFRNLIDFLKDDQWTSVASQFGMRQWIWQTCTEFAYYQTLNSYLQPFGRGLTVDNFVNTCKLSYGEKYDELYTRNFVDYTNNVYGGRTREGSRIVYVNGDKDPWSTLGLKYQNETNDENFVMLLPGKAHCSNVYQKLAGDSEDFIKAKEMIFEKLKFWLNPFY